LLWDSTRRGLKKLIEQAKKGKFDALVVTYPNRLTRFGFRYLEELFYAYGVRIETVFLVERKVQEKSSLRT